MSSQARRSAVQVVAVALISILLTVLNMPSESIAASHSGHIELSTAVEVLTSNVSLDGDSFVVDKLEDVIRWEITYRIANRSGSRQASSTFAVDRYGPELEIEWASATSGTVFSGASDEEACGEFVEWNGFSLEPWGEAELTVVLRTSNRSGCQEYASCGSYTLNMGMKAQYRMGQSSPIRELAGERYLVKVPCAPSMTVSLMSPEVEWLVRRPGDYYAQAFRGTVSSDVPVVIAFSAFNDLVNDTTGSAIPVYYSLQIEEPRIDDWVTPSQLNGAFLEITPSEITAEWSLWQRVVLGDQSVGTYADKGVITFTMLNVQDTIH